MKSILWTIAGLVAFAATPAFAATDLETGKAIVWGALAIVFLGAVIAIVGSLLIASTQKSTPQQGD